MTLVSKDFFGSGDEDEDDKRKKLSDKSYLVIKSEKGNQSKK